MRYKRDDRYYMLKVVKGEEVIEELIKFAKEESINAAAFHGIGACNKAEIAFYNIDNKEYEPMNIEQEMEITAIIGNIAMLNDEHKVHAHITLSDRYMRTMGGHLNKAVISGACEIFLTRLDYKLNRRYDHETGLNLLDI